MKMQATTDAQRLAVDSFRTFLATEVTPVVRALRGRPIPRERLRELTQGIADFGLPGASIAHASGGMGLSVQTEAMLLEELCVVSCEIAQCVIVNMLVARLLAELPEPQRRLRDRHLPGVLAGRSFAGFYLHGADALATVSEGGISAWSTADGWVLDGAQPWVGNGRICDFVITGVRTEGGGVCHVLVEREQHGNTSRIFDTPTLTGTFNTGLSFHNVRLPASQLIWQEQEGAELRARSLEKFNADTALLSVGLMRAVLEGCIVGARCADASGRPGASQPWVALRIAEMATRLDAARLMCLRAYSLVDAGSSCQVQVSMARWLASEMALKACQEALQLPGGKALGAALDLERLVRESIVLPVPHGVSDAQKLSIAEVLTGISALQPAINVVNPDP